MLAHHSSPQKAPGPTGKAVQADRPRGLPVAGPQAPLSLGSPWGQRGDDGPRAPRGCAPTPAMPSGSFCFTPQRLEGAQILREDAGPTWPQRRMGVPFSGMGLWDAGDPPAWGGGGQGGCSGFASCCPARHPL